MISYIPRFTVSDLKKLRQLKGKQETFSDIDIFQVKGANGFIDMTYFKDSKGYGSYNSEGITINNKQSELRI